MKTQALQKAILPLKYVLADSVYGTSPEFIEAVEACIDKTYFLSVPAGYTMLAETAGHDKKTV